MAYLIENDRFDEVTTEFFGSFTQGLKSPVPIAVQLHWHALQNYPIWNIYYGGGKRSAYGDVNKVILFRHLPRDPGAVQKGDEKEPEPI